MNQETGYIITALLAANTGILGIAAGLLLQHLKAQSESISRCHQRLDSHTGNHSIHAVSFHKT